MKTITLPVYGIVVTLGDGGGSITSELHEDVEPNEYNAAIDGVESLILAHACAGVNVESSGYLEGIETAVNAIAQNL
jgi:hypothetical protein